MSPATSALPDVTASAHGSAPIFGETEVKDFALSADLYNRPSFSSAYSVVPPGSPASAWIVCVGRPFGWSAFHVWPPSVLTPRKPFPSGAVRPAPLRATGFGPGTPPM